MHSQPKVQDLLLETVAANAFQMNNSLDSSKSAYLTTEFIASLDESISTIENLKCSSKCSLQKDAIMFEIFKAKLISYLRYSKEILLANANQKKTLEILSSDFYEAYEEQNLVSQKVNSMLEEWSKLKTNGDMTSKMKELEKQLIEVEVKLENAKDKKNKAYNIIKQSIKGMKIELNRIAATFSLQAANMINTNIDLAPFLGKTLILSI